MPKTRKKYGSYIFYDEKGVLYARVQIKQPNGKHKVIKKRAKNLTHVKQLADEIKNEYENRGGAYLDGRTMTFKDLAEWYKTHYVLAPVYVDGVKVEGLRTWKAERSKIDKIISELGAVLVNEMDEEILRKYKRKRLKTVGIAAANRDLESIRRMFRKANKKKWRTDILDFSELIDKSLEKRRTVTITREEEDRILEAAHGFTYSPRLYALILALRDSGARPNELYPVNDYESDYSTENTLYEPIRWRDLFEGDEIRSISQLVSYKGKRREVRLCVVTERMKQAFLELWAFLTKSRNTLPKNGPHLDNLVFPQTSFRTAFGIVREKAGMPDLRLRDLRRDWVTRLSRLGYSDRLGQRAAGHKRMQQTFEYTEFDLEAAMQAKDILDRDNVQELDGVN